MILIEVATEFGNRLAHRCFDLEVEEIVGEMRSHQELGGEVTDHADVVLFVAIDCREPSGQYAVTDGVSDGSEEFLVGGVLLRFSHHVIEIVENGASQGFNADCCAIVFNDCGGLRGCQLLHVAPPARGLSGYELRFRNADPSGARIGLREWPYRASMVEVSAVREQPVHRKFKKPESNLFGFSAR